MAWFPLQCALNSQPVIKAFADSLPNLGIKFVENSFDSDCLLIWSVLWAGRMRPNKNVYQLYRSSNRPVIIIEVGNLHRNHTWRISLNHITTQGYYGHKENLDPDRPKKLNVTLKNQAESNGKILIAAQHKDSLQLEGLDQEQWINEKIKEIRQYSNRTIVVRSHPRSRINTSLITNQCEFELPNRLPNTYDDFDINYQYHTVINYSSGPGIQAALLGTPIVVSDLSLAYPISNNIINIENPKSIDRQQWLIELCHTEYTLEEIRNGFWFHRLKEHL